MCAFEHILSFVTHTLKNIQEEDYGMYKCLSKNSHGDNEGSIQLYKLDTPTEPLGNKRNYYGISHSKWDLVGDTAMLQ